MKPLRILSSKDLGEVNDFLGELKDGAEYKKRLAALERQKKEINALILVLGKVNEINGLHLKASQLKKGADDLVADAQVDRAAAKTDATEIRAKARLQADATTRDATAKFTDREKALVDGEASIGRREKVVLRAVEDIEGREVVLARSMETALSIKKNYTKAVSDLKAAIEATQRAL